jgi:hypothetical protein
MSSRPSFNDVQPAQLSRTGSSSTLLPGYSPEETAPRYQAKTNKQSLAETLRQQSKSYEVSAGEATKKSLSSLTPRHRNKYANLANYNAQMARFGEMASRYMQTNDAAALTAAQESYEAALEANPEINETDERHTDLRAKAWEAVVLAQFPDTDLVFELTELRDRNYWHAYRSE